MFATRQLGALLLILLAPLVISQEFEFNDYTQHPCIRSCNNSTTKMVCKYNWTVEWYSVLSRACLQCPFNMTHCFNKDCVATNGVLRPVMVVNRMLPGPQINVCQGDVISVSIFNNLHLSEATSIHWHGLLQNGTPFMDGVSMITQCPILPHTHFQYMFMASEAGTHIWHAHATVERADGIFGPVIVHEYDQQNPYVAMYDFDLTQHVIVLNDWFNDSIIYKLTGHFHNNMDNKAHDILINGRSAFQVYTNDQGSFTTPRASFTVQQGSRYRFRLINAGVIYCPIEFSIDSHNLTVIASDGKLLEAYTVSSIVIYAGERYDFILTADQTIQNYWIRAKGLGDCSPYKAGQTAILNYANGQSPQDKPVVGFFNYNNMSRSGLQLNPLNTIIDGSNNQTYVNVDSLRGLPTAFNQKIYDKVLNATNVKKYYFTMRMHQIENPEFYNSIYYPMAQMLANNRTILKTPQFNEMSLMMPSTPVLYNWDLIPQKMICNHLNKSAACPDPTAFCACIYTLEFNLGDVVEFIFVDVETTAQTNHPIHLHGHAFALLGIQKVGPTVQLSDVIAMDQAGQLVRNLVNPPVKDTVMVPNGGYTVVRFVADNPGTWMVHCHLELHSAIGMSFLIKTGKKSDLAYPPPGWPTCGDFSIKGDSGVYPGPLNSVPRFQSSHGVLLLLVIVAVLL